jgi:hypothetical protein
MVSHPGSGVVRPGNATISPTTPRAEWRAASYTKSQVTDAMMSYQARVLS